MLKNKNFKIIEKRKISDIDSEYYKHTKYLIDALCGIKTSFYESGLNSKNNNHSYITSKESYERALKLINS